MRVLVAGATGVIGRELIPLLQGVGHEVAALTRSDGPRADALREGGVQALHADALDASAVRDAVRAAEPDVIVNMLTAIPARIDPRRFARDFGPTNRLRTEGTRNLADAAERCGVPRLISQGLAFVYDPRDREPAGEDAPWWADPPAPFVPVLEALRELEHVTVDAGGLVLRFGHLYGPGTAFAADGATIDAIRARKMPVIGGGDGVFSFLHAHDAATAVLASLDRSITGALNVVDDDPAPVRAWLPYLATLLGARPPQRFPTPLARLAAGAWATAYLTRLRGADNARARDRLGWRPRHASWREGFARELGARGTADSAA